MLTSWSEQSTPAELSIASVLMNPPASANSTRPICVRPRFLPDHAATQIAGVDTHGVVCLVAYVGVALVARLDVGADPPVPDEVDRRDEDRADQLGRRQGLSDDAQAVADLRRQGDRLRRAREDATPLGDE